jgi:hypothetical protein
VGIELISEYVAISIVGAVANDDDDLALLFGDDALGCADDGFHDVAVAGFVAADFVHPHVDDEDVGEGQAKESHLLLEHFIVGLSVCGVEALGVDEVEPVYVLEPDALGAALAGDGGVEDGEAGAEDFVEEGAFA